MTNKGIKIGSLFGIELRIDYSWIVIFLLVTLSFIYSLIPAVFPNLTPVETFVLGILSTVLFFVSVVIHEFAHSLYANRHGMKVRRITLFIFGGASEIKEEPQKPGHEFIMAALGPLTSIILSILFLGVWLLGTTTGVVALEVVGLLLSSINLILALFNLIPGFPLDGGRMLRGIVWKITGDFMKATRIAAGAGIAFAYILIAFGLFQLLVVGALGGLWLIFIGLFLRMAAGASVDYAQTRQLLNGVKIRDLMYSDPIIVPAHMKVKDFLQEYVLRYKKPSYLVASQSGYIEGILKVSDANEETMNEPVMRLARKHGSSVKPDDDANKIMELMATQNTDSIPVKQNGKIVGVLYASDVISYMAGKNKLRQTTK
jgi:Zn-dependent protease